MIAQPKRYTLETTRHELDTNFAEACWPVVNQQGFPDHDELRWEGEDITAVRAGVVVAVITVKVRSIITIAGAVAVFHEHRKDLLMACRTCPQGLRVLAEVDGDGTWRGAANITPGTGSLLAHEGRGYALYLDPSPFTSYADIDEAIMAWHDEEAERE